MPKAEVPLGKVGLGDIELRGRGLLAWDQSWGVTIMRIPLKPRPAVALLVETSNSYARGLLHGIMAYVQAHGPWSLHLREQGRGEPPPSWLSRWHGHGIIARIENVSIARVVAR